MKHNVDIRLRDLVDGFLFSLRAEGKSNSTLDYYSYLLHPLLRYAGQQGWPDSVRSLDVNRLRQFLTWTATRTFQLKVANNGGKVIKKAKPSTAWPYYRALRRLFNWAVEEGYLESSPLATIHFKPPPVPPIEGYTTEDLKRLLAVCDLDIRSGGHFTGIRNKAMLLLFIDSGLRRAEMVHLKLSDLDLESRRVRVLGKGNKIGIAPFSSKTAKALWAWLIERKPRAKTDRLLVTEEGQAFSLEGLVSWFTRLKKRADVNGPGGVHRLRHTAALAYLRGAKDSFLLQLFLRHESLEMSRRYTRGLKAEEAIQAHRNGASPVESLGLG
ncbi:MAG TPA: tyrosine-type recombinase/integrase [Dehalococcoidales bacterium]|nr:tyrosine-type recombinase/integrase [Dehalococcoidales bacterium]